MAGRNAAKRTTPRKTSGREGRANAVADPSTTAVLPAGSPPAPPQKSVGSRGADPSNGGSGESVKGRYADLQTFLKSVAVEWRRVTWPDKNQLRAATLVVLFTLIVFSGYLGILDAIFIKIFTSGKH